MLKNGLLKLEYRGYDSAGAATVDNGSLFLKKDVGKIAEMDSKHNIASLPGCAGIAHTRWATHGGVTKDNAHPHTCCSGKIAVVHNGIIEGYQERRAALESAGHSFASQTDTEVIPHLIEESMKGGKCFRDAVFETASSLEGSFAIAAICASEPDTVVTVRKESPAVVGIGDNECFVASDVIPFLGRTNRAVFLEDGEGAVLTKSGAAFYDYRTGRGLSKQEKKIEWSADSAGKNGYEHYLLKEIHEQPVVLKETLRQDRAKLQKVAHLINASPRVAIVACGTSRHAALVGRYVISEIAGKYCEVYMASEFQYFVDKLGKDTLIIALSQSGETADVLVPIRRAKRNGCKVVSIINVVGSSLDREADTSLYINCGPEISVASTKAFTSQLAVFYMLAYTMAFGLEEALPLLRELPDKIRETITKTEPPIKKLAKELKDANDVYFIARGENFAVATEGALKLKEISYMHAEGMPAGELKHGTLALVTKGTPVIAICPNDHTYQEMLSNVAEAKARGARIVAITDRPNEIFDLALEIPKVDPVFYPLLTNIPCQLIAYYCAVARGNDVDKPRNLAKSVTVR